MPPASNPGDTVTPPVTEPAAPAAPSTPTPSGSEADINPGDKSPAMVPSDRLREETEKRRQAEEELRAYREAHPEQPTTPPQNTEGDDLDPDVEKILDAYAKKHGLVSQRELNEKAAQEQVKQDVRDLEAEYANSGVPFTISDVMKYARENNIPVNSKSSLRAIYRDMNFDKLVEAERQRTITQVKEGERGGVERPGAGGNKAPQEPKVTGRDPKERNLSRIRQARQALSR